MPIPVESLYLMPNHFVCSANIEYINETINNFLLAYNSIRFQFNNDNNRWEILYYKNTILCKMEINTYTRRNSTDYIIELNRLSGEAYAFLWIRTKITNIFIPNSFPDRNEDEMNPFIPAPLPEGFHYELSYEDAFNAIQPIIDMANSDSIYGKRMAVKLLCEMTYEDDIKHNLPSFGCIEVFMNLLETMDQEVLIYALDGIFNMANNQENIDRINNHQNNNLLRTLPSMIDDLNGRAHIDRLTINIIRKCKYEEICLRHRKQFMKWYLRSQEERIKQQYHPDILREALEILGEDSDEDIYEYVGWSV